MSVSRSTPRAPGIGRLLREILFHRAQGWQRGKSLHRQLVESLDDDPAEFDRLIGRVARELESNPRREIFLQFLRDDRQLRDEEVADLVEYLYSSIVNNFKGELAELLSRPVLRRFSARLGGGEVIAGWDVAEPQLRFVAGRRSWRKGADALVVRNEGGRLIIVAVAEIKSYRASADRMQMQIAKHIARLQKGLRLRGRELAPEEYAFLVVSGKVASLAIRTAVGQRRGPTISRGRDAVAELAFTKAELAYAAYAFAEWFLARLGPVVFDERNPWPEDTLETAGRHATLEALYHLVLRLRRLCARESTRRNRRALNRTLWLYNAMAFGYDNASGEEMVWFDDKQSGVDRSIEVARDRYRESDFDEARRILAEAAPQCETEKQVRELRWLQGMAAYRDVRLAEARSVFPGPGNDVKDIWRHRDAAMAARLAARTGDLEAAQSSLADAVAWRWRMDDYGVGVELEGVSALIAAARDDTAGVRECSRCAKELRESLGRQVDAHRAARIADPEIDWQALTMGKLDLASALAAVGELGDAEWWVRAIATKEDPWIGRYVQRDPLLAPIRDRLADWIGSQVTL
jgi:hypothetical protein